jgi:hypothetical protein
MLPTTIPRLEYFSAAAANEFVFVLFQNRKLLPVVLGAQGHNLINYYWLVACETQNLLMFD